MFTRTLTEKSGKVVFHAVSWIQILWASWSRGRILLSSNKNSRKNLDSYCFVTSLWLFILEKWCKCSLKSSRQKKVFCLKVWKSRTNPDKLVRGTVPLIRIWNRPKCHGSTTLTFLSTVTKHAYHVSYVDWSTCTRTCPVTLNTLNKIL